MLFDKKWIFGCILIFLGNSLLLAQETFPKVLSIMIVLLGHLLFLIFGRPYFGMAKIIQVNIIIGIVFTIYYFVCGQYHLGILHNLIIALILWLAIMYLKRTK